MVILIFMLTIFLRAAWHLLTVTVEQTTEIYRLQILIINNRHKDTM